MIDRDGNRVTSQTWRGDDYSKNDNPDIIDHVPTQSELTEKEK